MTPAELTLLRVVRAGAICGSDVAVALGLSLSTVIVLAQGLVARELLCALDGEPWAIRVEALPLLAHVGEGA